MTDEELIARLLADETDLSDCAVNRIEALVKERDEALNQLDSARHSVDVLEKRLTDKMAKLAKAVEALREIMDDAEYPDAVWERGDAVLAELDGK